MDTFHLLARYNQRFNAQLAECTRRLSVDELARDRGAFFGSIIGTLNHIVVADTIWLSRFACHPAAFNALHHLREAPIPTTLDAVPFPQLADWDIARRRLDATILAFVDEIMTSDLELAFEYTNTRGVRFRKRFSHLLTHFFNHQTHHRGQVTTLLAQQGIDVGVTDLLLDIPDVGDTNGAH